MPPELIISNQGAIGRAAEGPVLFLIHLLEECALVEFDGFLKILPVFIFVLPGMIAAALYTDVRSGAGDTAYPALVTRLD